MAGTGDDPRHVMMNCENHTNDNNFILLFLVENIIRCFPSHVSGRSVTIIRRPDNTLQYNTVVAFYGEGLKKYPSSKVSLIKNACF